MTEEQVSKLFAYAHLPPHLQEISQPYHQMAMQLQDRFPSAEGTLAIRKLWEAKNLVVWCGANQ
tara:strand:+ start:1274 stop:1465 length:192 start_codon:yes stop_codon:yes gene_type:complete